MADKGINVFPSSLFAADGVSLFFFFLLLRYRQKSGREKPPV